VSARALLCCLIWFGLLASGFSQPVIEIPVFEGGEGLDFFQSVAKQYQLLHPDQKVNLYGDPRISEKLRIRLLENSYPEITNASLNYWKLIDLGKLQALPLQKYPDWRQSFLPGSLNQFQLESGPAYGVPFVLTVHAVWYNRKLFRQHNWSVPKSWADFDSLCIKMRTQGVAPLAFQGRYSFYIQPVLEHLIYQRGGAMLYSDVKTLQPGAFLRPEVSQALTDVQNLAQKHFLGGWQGMSHTEAQMAFFQGKSAMVICGSWLKGEMAGNIPADFELGEFSLPVPTSPNSNPHANYTSSAYYFVFSQSAHPDLACDFLRFMTSMPIASQFVKQRDIPVAIKGANAHLSKDLAGLAEMIESTEVCYGEPPGPGHPEMTQAWSDIREDLLTGKIPPAQASQLLENAAEKCRQIKPRRQGSPLLEWTFGFICLAILSWVWRRKSTSKQDHPSWQLWSPAVTVQFLAIPLLVYGLFFGLPALAAGAGSLLEWDGLSSPQWTGLDNFSILLSSPRTWVAIANNAYLALLPAFCTLPISLALAFGLSRVRSRYRKAGWKFLRAVLFFPNLMGIAGLLLWQQIYNPSGGPLNRLLSFFGLPFESFAWLSQEHLYHSLIPMAVWSQAGFFMVLLLAAMDSVPNEFYESSEIDGATSWQQFRWITLPSIAPTLAVCIIFLVTGGLKAFESVWILTNQSPTSNHHVLGTLLMQESFQNFHLGSATAIGVLLLVLSLTATLTIQWLAEKLAPQ
jgi:ABC-type sugar transport system permease subunit/ABC-type glycerol-3-phosphate transport system substrate-binding protein